MSGTTHQTPLRMKTHTGQFNLICTELITNNCKLTTAITAARCTNCTAVAAAGSFAAFVPFQWQQAKLLPP